MIKITRETDYGVVLLTTLAQNDCAASATTLARQCRLPGPMAGKILKILSQGGLLESQRGPQGGYALARPAHDISMAEVVEVLEGPIALTACSHEADSQCEYISHCGVSTHWNRINTAIRAALQNISLAEMAQAPNGTQALETVPLVDVSATASVTLQNKVLR